MRVPMRSLDCEAPVLANSSFLLRHIEPRDQHLREKEASARSRSDRRSALSIGATAIQLSASTRVNVRQAVALIFGSSAEGEANDFLSAGFEQTKTIFAVHRHLSGCRVNAIVAPSKDGELSPLFD